MPTRPTFMGSSVTRVNSAVGWGGTGSTLDLTLVDDPTNGDSFTPSTVGGPVYFSIGSYTFNGIFRKYTVDKNRNGYPTYNVQVIDPRHLLDSCKLILADYRLSVTGIYNLFNVFGYWENTGYGYSQTNDTGMPWQLIQSGITSICNAAAGSWGGPITYRGTSYSIDISALPALPSYFRIGGHGHGLSILEFIQACCDAASCDFLVKLVGTTITLVVVPRINAYPLGTISTILNTTFAGTVVRSSAGIEERDETCSVFLIGGNVNQLYKVEPDSAFQFWGFNASGTIMYGGADKHAVFYAKHRTNNTDGQQIYSLPVKMYTLYVPEISSIIGGTQWFTNDLELQVLLGLGNTKDSFGSWVEYLKKSDPDMYLLINGGPQSTSFQPGHMVPENPNNRANTRPERITDIQAAGRSAITQTGIFNLKLVYEALFKYAKDYYGKKWALGIPGIAKYADVETGAISVSHEPTEGGFVGESDVNDLLDLPSYAADLFQTQDARYVAYAKFNVTNADLSRVNPGNTLIDGDNLFVKGRVHNQIYFDGTDPFAVMEIDPLYDYPNAVVGVSGIVGALLRATGINLEASPGSVTNEGQITLDNMVKGQVQGSVSIVTHPAARIPSGYEVPLKSNVLTYGPWYAQGSNGRVRYQQESSLVPWNYGSYSGLNVAGNAKAVQGLSYAQVIETGYIEVEGAPAYNLGDVIVANGTNITGISVGWGSDSQGMTTTYRFETYVPKFGDIARYNVDRLQRLSIANIHRSAEAKALNRLNNLGALAEAEGQRTLNMLASLPPAVNIRTPLNGLVATVFSSSGGEFRHPSVSSTTYEEMLGLIPPSGTDYNNTVVGTWESIVVPYQVGSLVNPTGAYIPKFVEPAGVFDDSSVMNADTLNPFKSSPSGSTIRYYSKGERGYEELNDNYLLGEDQTNKIKRSFASKAPLVLCGWGFDKYGNLPTDSDYLRNFERHKSGPLDPLWDEDRGVWTVHDIMNGTLAEDITIGSSGLVTVNVNGTDDFEMYTYNWGESDISNGTKVQIGYVANNNKWYLLNGGIAGSGTGGGGGSESSCDCCDIGPHPDYLYERQETYEPDDSQFSDNHFDYYVDANALWLPVDGVTTPSGIILVEAFGKGGDSVLVWEPGVAPTGIWGAGAGGGGAYAASILQISTTGTYHLQSVSGHVVFKDPYDNILVSAEYGETVYSSGLNQRLTGGRGGLAANSIGQLKYNGGDGGDSGDYLGYFGVTIPGDLDDYQLRLPNDIEGPFWDDNAHIIGGGGGCGGSSQGGGRRGGHYYEAVAGLGDTGQLNPVGYLAYRHPYTAYPTYDELALYPDDPSPSGSIGGAGNYWNGPAHPLKDTSSYPGELPNGGAGGYCYYGSGNEYYSANVLSSLKPSGVIWGNGPVIRITPGYCALPDYRPNYNNNGPGVLILPNSGGSPTVSNTLPLSMLGVSGTYATGNDENLGLLNYKLQQGSGIYLELMNPGGNEYYQIHATGVSGGGVDNYNFKTTASDTTPNYADNKIVVGSGLFKQVLNPGANETLELNVDFSQLPAGSDNYTLKSSASDTTPNYGFNKITAGSGIFTQIINPGGNEEVQVNVDYSQIPSSVDNYTLKTSASDTTPNYGFNKIVVGSGLFAQIINPGGDEQVELNIDYSEIPGGSDNYTVKVTSSDTTPGFINEKIIEGNFIQVEVLGSPGNETFRINATGLDGTKNVLNSYTDTTAHYLSNKLVAGSGIILVSEDIGGNELLRVHSSIATDSGFYTPGVSYGANLNSYTTYEAQYIRVGDVVTVSGKLDVTPAAYFTNTGIGLNIPVGATFSSTNDAAGSINSTRLFETASGLMPQCGAVRASNGNAYVIAEFTNADVTNETMYYHYTYRVR